MLGASNSSLDHAAIIPNPTGPPIFRALQPIRTW